MKPIIEEQPLDWIERIIVGCQLACVIMLTILTVVVFVKMLISMLTQQ